MSQKNKDYYKILGITDKEKNLPWEEFENIEKEKYKTLAKKYHPDKQHGKSEEEKKKAEEMFKDISEAHEILSKKDKKAEYDHSKSSSFSWFGGGNSPFEGFNPFRNFDPFEVFSANGFQNRNSGIPKGNSIRIEIPLTIEEIFTGVTKKIKFKRQEPCHECGGSGLSENGKIEMCPTCGGTGQEYRANGNIQMLTTCRRCHGTGKIMVNPCKNCQGSGLELKEHEVSIDIPKGVISGAELILQGEGSLTASKDGIPGDLHVLISEKEHERFIRRNNDLLFKLEIPVLDAITGAKINVSTIDGKTLSTTISQGTEEGSTLKFANKGLPIYGQEGRFGHMIGVVSLKLPKNLNKEERELIEQLKEKEHFKSL